MKSLRRNISLLLWLLVPTQASAITFADGEHHVIDAASSRPLEGVVVEDGPGGSQTSLDVLDGREIATAYEVRAGLLVRGHSAVRILGGTVGNTFVGVEVRDDAEVTVSGGFVRRGGDPRSQARKRVPRKLIRPPGLPPKRAARHPRCRQPASPERAASHPASARPRTPAPRRS